MTSVLGRDPARRCRPLAEWPVLDATIWRAALTPGDLLEPGGERAGHASGSNHAAEGGYGRWLT
ncbi:hypothetical protein ACFQY5_15435 [Paeniroseomonas aquatica]|uniref:Uncharacterized protein n=1 Tax=Paeniroseomonas aquatica TaxID=373043 RepID=A0ABT8AFM3_9PROT|nr:hypothetical protein [Paeniroseomonas aquatica]MDN3568488.1 hypothetical protein [Paeniroseomonas aquatica]